MFEKELAQLEHDHLLRQPKVIDSYDGPRVTIAGRSLLLMCSNDYLGLANHPSLEKAASLAMGRYGFGSGASRLVSGTSALHRELEERIAEFKGTDSALLFNSGYAANTGIIPALAREGDVILSDSLNHASIIDGCRLSRARVKVYAHKDMGHLEDLLKKGRAAARRLIITDGVFSMDGDIAPLPDLVLLSEKYDAMLMVDDAHATGVLGRTGRGTAEHFGLEGRVHIQMGTLGKALGSFGAFAAGRKDVITLLMNRARSLIYSTALPPSVCAASLAAFAITEQEPRRRESLWKNRERLVSGLTSIGISIGSSQTPIIPLLIGDSDKALQAGTRLFDNGIYAAAIRPPTVADNTSRIRMTLMSTHSDDDIGAVLAVLNAMYREGFFNDRRG
jgi:8-amino-7-oxononanoate synthase